MGVGQTTRQSGIGECNMQDIYFDSSVFTVHTMYRVQKWNFYLLCSDRCNVGMEWAITDGF